MTVFRSSCHSLRDIMNPRVIRTLLVSFGLLLLTGTVSALPVRGEFWVTADLLEIAVPGENLRENSDLSEREKNALKQLLEDARWAFSGMIYGYSVQWTPPSGSRKVADELSIKPIALIPTGDPRMSTVSVTREGGFIYILLEYRPDPAQEARITGWGSEALPLAAGSGLVPSGPGDRRAAMEAAVRDAIFQWLRKREYNRPREIRGTVAFTEFPRTGLLGGRIKADVTVRMDIKTVRAYEAD